MSTKPALNTLCRPCSLLLLVALGLTSACGSPSAPPVAALKVDLRDRQLPYPEWRTVSLSWTPAADLPAGSAPVCFVHLRSIDGKVVRTFDHTLPDGWQVGQPLRYDIQLYQSALAPALAPGEYQLLVGLYDAASGGRWPLAVEGADETGRRAYRVGSLEVPQSTPDAPRFTFSEEWQAPEEGQDSQVLARRWLTRHATLQVSDLDVPGSLWLRLHLPPPQDPQADLVLDAPDQAPALTISSSCSDATHSLEPTGIHQLVLPVYAAPGSTGCQIELTANYAVRLPDGELRSAAMEVLSWTSAQL